MSDASTSIEEISRSYKWQQILWRRWLSLLIDLTLSALLLLLCAMCCSLAHQRGLLGMLFSGCILLSYYVTMEVKFGKTVGKFATKLTVVDSTGNTPAVWQATVRTLLRIVETNPFLIGALPAGLCVTFSEAHQRIGDMLAKTYVLRDGELQTFHERDRHDSLPE